MFVFNYFTKLLNVSAAFSAAGAKSGLNLPILAFTKFTALPKKFDTALTTFESFTFLITPSIAGLTFASFGSTNLAISSAKVFAPLIALSTFYLFV